jgi:hypothetical protein
LAKLYLQPTKTTHCSKLQFAQAAQEVKLQMSSAAIAAAQAATKLKDGKFGT